MLVCEGLGTIAVEGEPPAAGPVTALSCFAFLSLLFTAP